MAERSDSERLDWLEETRTEVGFIDDSQSAEWVLMGIRLSTAPTLRQAIDRAMDAEREDHD